ncbi:LysR family transcriptional regulator [Luteibacter rhizovicinus DSM 16549]|uniref:LysR family transcriptional regulator n=1 Tax=Luteibacter rhizovicinus DSM 16549 TaxID=1440763 RepID=A0A0G9HAX8_9GAMM|nr:LysR substrate-binding domain-containing protein [Luteibacter rhizovicinus]APG03861.1 LysR family transcriptional regulator [Luteibacter rhizovicinus DSM 16549]KLD66389.1 LysR family transcriptional regulator [Luteibacter rhizovicinus DSM 16549]KLD80089.1 LysR family transcriptional regulator [Xanthomonas hyacinthi DSM 19077]
MDLLALADFDVVALHGGFGAASRATGRPKATLSRRVRELEDALGVRLIERGARPFRLTEEGATLHAEAHAMLGRIEDVAEGLVARAGAPRGALRVSAPVLFAHRGLGRLAARFAMNFPAVHLEVVVDDRFVDPLKEGFDVVIRANPAPSTDLAGRCFLRDRLVVAAAPSLPQPADGGTFPAIMLGGSQLSAWRLVAEGRPTTMLPQEIVRLSSMALVYDAVREGVGAAMMPASLIGDDIASGALTSWGEVEGRSIEVWALYPPQRHVAGKVSAFVGMLVDHFRDASPTHFDTL